MEATKTCPPLNDPFHLRPLTALSQDVAGRKERSVLEVVLMAHDKDTKR